MSRPKDDILWMVRAAPALAPLCWVLIITYVAMGWLEWPHFTIGLAGLIMALYAQVKKPWGSRVLNVLSFLLFVPTAPHLHAVGGHWEQQILLLFSVSMTAFALFPNWMLRHWDTHPEIGHIGEYQRRLAAE